MLDVGEEYFDKVNIFAIVVFLPAFSQIKFQTTQGANGFHRQIKRWQKVNNYVNFFIPHFEQK